MMRTAFGFPRTGDRGFTLAEVLVATFVLSIGLVAVATGFQYATSGIETGKGETQAVFLAEQRIEQLKGQAITNFNASSGCSAPLPSTCLAAGTTTENYNSMTSAPFYKRTTLIQDSPAGTGPGIICGDNCKKVTVTVNYKPVTARGEVDQERSVVLVVMLAPRT